MKVARKIKQLGKKMDRKLSGVKRKVVKKRAVIAQKTRRVARTSGKRAPQGAESVKRKATRAKRTAQSIARETGEAVGKFLGKAIGKAERIINKTVGTAKGSLS